MLAKKDRGRFVQTNCFLNQGFTLLEMILCLFVLYILLGLGISVYGSHAGTVREKLQQTNIERIEGAAQLYRLDTGVYPNSVQQLLEAPLGLSGWRGPYLDYYPVNSQDPTQAYQINSLGQVH